MEDASIGGDTLTDIEASLDGMKRDKKNFASL
jgi:hypothetical protein